MGICREWIYFLLGSHYYSHEIDCFIIQQNGQAYYLKLL